jgi:carbon storage regulator
MLVLSRKDGQAIRIGDDVTIKVSEISGGRVKLAIDAPREVPIRRSELSSQSHRQPQNSDAPAPIG